MTKSLYRAVGSLTNLEEANAIIAFMEAHNNETPITRGRDNGDPAEYRCGQKEGLTNLSRKDAKRIFKEKGPEATIMALPTLKVRLVL